MAAHDARGQDSKRSEEDKLGVMSPVASTNEKAVLGNVERASEDMPESQKVPSVDRLPRSVWIVAIAGATERFAYYAMTAPLQNYIQNPRSGSANPGALGLGQQTATNITNAFMLLQFLASMPFALLADLRLGRFKTMVISLIISQCGFLILFVTSLPAVLDRGGGLPGLIVALILIAFGVAGVKATLPPFLVDQYDRTEPRALKEKRGKQQISDRTLTIQFITNMFYWFINIAALSSLASTWIEKKVDFWASYLLGFACLLVTQVLTFLWRKNFVTVEPQGSRLPLALKAIWCAVRHRFSISAAMPDTQLERYGKQVEWDTATVEDAKSALIISRVLLFCAPFSLAVLQLANNLISQAGQMRLDGVPNDTMQTLNPIACILLGPVIQRGLFPLLRRMGFSFRPIARISTACLIMGFAMAYAAGIQHLIYTKGLCYDRPLTCQARGETAVGNDISVWVQTPVWFITAFGEILGFATMSEIAYELAPKSMKSLVQAVVQMTAGLATVMGIALSPLARDPRLVTLYTVVAVLTTVASGLFWFFFKGVDKEAK